MRRSPRSRLARLPDLLRLTQPRRTFSVVLLAIITAVIFQLAAPETDLARFLAVVIQGSVVVIALRAAGANPHVLRMTAAAMVAVSVIVAITLIGADGRAPDAAPRLLTLVLILLTPAAVVAGVVREFREDRMVTVQTVYCGLCLYLLLGMAFAFLFGAIEDLSGEPFFAAGLPGTPNDFLYFSLATLTTTGYGDFTAATELGRAMSVTEALIGEMYLVTVLAVIVSRIGTTHADRT